MLWIAWFCGPFVMSIVVLWPAVVGAESCIAWTFLGQIAAIVLTIVMFAMPGPHRTWPELWTMALYVGGYGAAFAAPRADWAMVATPVLAGAVPVIALARALHARSRPRTEPPLR